MINRLITALFVAAFAPAALASQPGVVAMKNWKTMDLCTKKAQMAFPDYTAESNARRDAQLKACLAGQNLPPREPLAPPQ
ncbi:MAG TPA: hypothetical protein VKQ73_12695 [Stellaceae bacterium]|nr:hypothetical protein [Stellaceae bacterium]